MGAIYRNIIRLFMIIYLLYIEYIVYIILFTSYTLINFKTNQDALSVFRVIWESRYVKSTYV